MAKRLTDSNKWNDSWFNDLPADMKLVWLYILDACDHAGVYKVSYKSIVFFTGTERTQSEIIEYLKERIYIAEDKWFIPKFITFQYKNFFTSNTPAIKSARELLISHNIIQPNDNSLPTITKGLDNACITLIQPLDKDYIRTKDKDKDKDMDKDKDKDNGQELSYGVAYKLYQQLLNYEMPISEYNEVYDDITEIGWDKFFSKLNLSVKEKKQLDEVITIKLK